MSLVLVAPVATGVRAGIEVFLDDVPAALRGKRVGLITSNTGVDRSGRSDIDLIARHDGLALVALLAPEHGIRGTAEAGVTVADGVDAKTGVPVYSLYAAQRHSPTPGMLKDVDVLVYDLQEVGGRTWTYVSTMALSMQAAARKGIPFVVLDRPNPIGGDIVEGALLDGHRLSGRHRLGRRHRRQVSGTKHPGRPVIRHRSAGLPTGPHGAAAHRHDPQTAPGGLRLGAVDRRAYRIRSGPPG